MPAVSHHVKTFTVAPSPFNTVKFELGVILILGILLVLVHSRITSSTKLQFLLLSAYGILGMVWIVIRTRRIMMKLPST